MNSTAQLTLTNRSNEHEDGLDNENNKYFFYTILFMKIYVTKLTILYY